ncbi:uncharacterized protein LOC106167694 [Lingula anatina]|uniref:Uncharacterized protein LOC106167694 n=1 Tax=Lingula anatina TaxID=7574 RepID=A0A1S3IUV5_LINAN|nr:uncharacterized protein LOC106167694 [Lingula anatina]|eukprot:XP_013401985.1 uncharacterized protein LOC106167694 [Lingula anatina]
MVLSDAHNNKLFILSSHWEVQQTVDVNNPFGLTLSDSCTKITVAQGDQKSYTGPDNKLGQAGTVCVDAYDNILVTDSDNHCIHLVSRDGKFIRFIATKTDGLCKSWACAINQGGDLAVTKPDGEVKVFQYWKK